MRRLLAAFSGAVLAVSFLVAPSVSAQAAQDVSYLFVVDSTDIRVTALKGDAARVEISGAAVTRFTDRPQRQAESIGVRGMLREFGWTSKSKRLKDATPNAAISIAGVRSQIVDIKRARVADGRVVLRVVGINGALESMRGAGSIFIDNAVTYPQTQTVTITNMNPNVSPTLATAFVVLQSATTATVTLDLSPIGPGFTDRVFSIDIGTEFEQSWSEDGTASPGMTAFDVEIDSDGTSNSTSIRISLRVSLFAETASGFGSAFFL